jgi:hypothetical protein
MSDLRRGLGGFADLTIKNDVQGELSLTDAECRTLEYIAGKSGEINWDWADPTTKRATFEMMTDLINKELVREREHVDMTGSVKRVTIKLTEKGGNVLDVHRKRKIVAGKVIEA